MGRVPSLFAMLGSAWPPDRAGGDEGGEFAGLRRTDEHDGGLLQSHHRGDRADEGEAQQQLHEGIADGEADDFLPAVQVAAGAAEAPRNGKIQRRLFQ
jgi:hypothetical protein